MDVTQLSCARERIFQWAKQIVEIFEPVVYDFKTGATIPVRCLDIFVFRLSDLFEGLNIPEKVR